MKVKNYNDFDWYKEFNNKRVRVVEKDGNVTIGRCRVYIEGYDPDDDRDMEIGIIGINIDDIVEIEVLEEISMEENSYNDFDLYYQFAGKRVFVRLKNGETYRGRCKIYIEGWDPDMDRDMVIGLNYIAIDDIVEIELLDEVNMEVKEYAIVSRTKSNGKKGVC